MLKKAATKTPAPDRDDKRASVESVKALLPVQTFPVIHAVLDGSEGEPIAAEIDLLLRNRLLTRPPRRPVKRIVHLTCAGYDEPVLIKDISATGVRLLLSTNNMLDLKLTLDMALVVRLPEGRHSIPLSLVRICGRQGDQLDVGCRFLHPGPEHEELVTEIRNYFFND